MCNDNSKLTRRHVVYVVAAIWLGFTATCCSAAEDPKKEPLSAKQVLEEKPDGQVTVKVHVQEWLRYRGASAGPREPQTLVLRDTEPNQPRLDVVVYPEVFDRLKALGINNPPKHFEGKTVVVTGTVGRNQTPFGLSNILWVKDLDQIRSIEAER